MTDLYVDHDLFPRNAPITKEALALLLKVDGSKVKNLGIREGTQHFLVTDLTEQEMLQVKHLPSNFLVR